MVEFEINKEYLLKLGQAEPKRAIYLGIKRYSKSDFRYIFMSYNSKKSKFGVYLGKLEEVVFDKKVVHMKFPQRKKLKPSEIKLIGSLVDKLIYNQ